MTQVSKIISAAFRETNLTAIGQAPSTDEQAEGLAALINLVQSAVGGEIGYILEDWNVSDTAISDPSGVPLATTVGFTVKPNSRLMCGAAAPFTLALDPQPQDGQFFSVVDVLGTFAAHNVTINPNGRKINGGNANLVLSTANLRQEWLYRSDLGGWTVLNPIGPTDDFPFPQDFDDYFVILLAMRLNPRYGKNINPQSKARFDQQSAQFVNRYTQSRLRSVPGPAANNPAHGGGDSQ